MEIEKIKNLGLETKLKKSMLFYNESMSKHTSFKTGGPCDLFVEVSDKDELITLITIAKENDIPITVVGNGSNLLVKDSGIDGIVIKYNNRDIDIDVNSNDNLVIASSGVINAYLGNILLEYELGGFEFACGIPGTLGGAIYMNAGAYGSEMKDVVVEVEYLNLDNLKIESLNNEQLEFAYRTSIFQSKINAIILSVKMKFEKTNALLIKDKMDEYRDKRLNSQPLEYPSAGSTFKRLDDFLTAKAIDEAGLKGYSIGGAEVSSKHAGFIVNKGNATSQDIIDLIEHVQKVILEKYNKKIETEVRIIGR